MRQMYTYNVHIHRRCINVVSIYCDYYFINVLGLQQNLFRFDELFNKNNKMISYSFYRAYFMHKKQKQKTKKKLE